MDAVDPLLDVELARFRLLNTAAGGPGWRGLAVSPKRNAFLTLESIDEALEDDLIEAFAIAGGIHVGSLRFSRMEPRGCCASTAGFGGTSREASSVEGVS